MLKIITCILLLLCTGFPGTKVFALEVMLPQVYKENINISRWLVSEKLDGVRGYWDGKTLLSRNGIPFRPPAAFTHNFPNFAIEGEIWGGRGSFEQTLSAVKKHGAPDGWLGLEFAIFDVPEASGGTLQRLKKAQIWFAKNPSKYAFVIPQKPLGGKKELQEELSRVESLGGEGLIVRNPNSLYHNGRSGDILKVKSYYDMEAVVIDHVAGKKKDPDELGSLLVELPNGTRFKIGTGFSDAERRNPPPIGATITFKYYGWYQSGIPKFPVFLRVRK